MPTRVSAHSPSLEDRQGSLSSVDTFSVLLSKPRGHASAYYSKDLLIKVFEASSSQENAVRPEFWVVSKNTAVNAAVRSSTVDQAVSAVMIEQPLSKDKENTVPATIAVIKP